MTSGRVAMADDMLRCTRSSASPRPPVVVSLLSTCVLVHPRRGGGLCRRRKRRRTSTASRDRSSCRWRARLLHQPRLAGGEGRRVEEAPGQRQHEREGEEAGHEGGEHAVGQQQRAHAAVAGVQGTAQRRAAGVADVAAADSCATGGRRRHARHQVHLLEVAVRQDYHLGPRCG